MGQWAHIGDGERVAVSIGETETVDSSAPMGCRWVASSARVQHYSPLNCQCIGASLGNTPLPLLPVAPRSVACLLPALLAPLARSRSPLRFPVSPARPLAVIPKGMQMCRLGQWERFALRCFPLSL